MSQHLDTDALADVLAGGHEPHLDGCPHCRGRLAELSAAMPAVTTALAALPDPPLPDGLERRLLAAVQQGRTPNADVLPMAPRRTRWLPALGAVAAAAALVTGGLLVAGRGGSDKAGTSSLGGPSYAVSETGTNYTAAPGSLSAALPALLAGHAQRASAEDSAVTPAPLSAGQASKGVQSPGAVMGPLTPGAPDALAPLRTTAGLARCLASLTDPGDTGLPLALDYASFNGAPALVVVLPSTRPDKVDVLVVPPGCAQADGRVLFFTRLPKP